jgi:hypothetical protein
LDGFSDIYYEEEEEEEEEEAQSIEIVSTKEIYSKRCFQLEIEENTYLDSFSDNYYEEEEEAQSDDYIKTEIKRHRYIVFQLLYRSSRDGSQPKKFHKRCDNKGPTLTIIRDTDGNVFGGFTSMSWNKGVEGYIYDEHAFLFTLKNPYNIEATKFAVSEP